MKTIQGSCDVLMKAIMRDAVAAFSGGRWVVPGMAVLLLFAGCAELKVDRPGAASEADWLTEGDSGQREQVTRSALEPPLEEVWVYNANAGFGPGSPLILGKTILVGTRKGEIHAIDFETGKRKGTEGFGDVVDGTPLIEDGVLFIPVGWGRQAVYAYDLARGQTRWKRKGAPISTGLLALEDAVVGVDAEARVRKYAMDDGAILWEQALGDRVTVHATPVLTDGVIVIADDQGRIVALDPADGSTQWTKALASPVYTSIAAAEGALFVPSTRGRFFALDAARGHIRWQVALPDTTVRFTAPAVDGSLVVVGASDGALRAFDAATGTQRWLFQDAAALTATPLLTPSAVYIGNMGHSLFAVDRQTGALEWEGELRGRVKSALAAREGYLVVLSEPRFVYLFKSSSASSDVASP